MTPRRTKSGSEIPAFRLGPKEVTLTHLNRVYFPGPGYTKAEVLDYYLRVSPYLLPHIKGRPLTLERWPEGLEDGSFFQKDASSYFPSWLHTFPVKRRDGQKIIHYPLVEDEADLLYLVNQGTITFHTQMSRVNNPEHPDLMVLDIDPPEDEDTAAQKSSPTGNPDLSGALTPFQRAAQVALLLRGRLQAAGYDPLVKTSGKRGVHLAFPLEGRLDYESARSHLSALFADLAARHPELLTTQIRKAKREGRVYLDALRMSLGATIVPPYVIRPTLKATVSTPVTWKELGTLRDGDDFTIKTTVARLRETGDLWEALT